MYIRRKDRITCWNTDGTNVSKNSGWGWESFEQKKIFWWKDIQTTTKSSIKTPPICELYTHLSVTQTQKKSRPGWACPAPSLGSWPPVWQRTPSEYLVLGHHQGSWDHLLVDWCIHTDKALPSLPKKQWKNNWKALLSQITAIFAHLLILLYLMCSYVFARIALGLGVHVLSRMCILCALLLNLELHYWVVLYNLKLRWQHMYLAKWKTLDYLDSVHCCSENRVIVLHGPPILWPVGAGEIWSILLQDI